MVRAGFATAYRRYSNEYVDEENEARNARRGIWAGEFTNPGPIATTKHPRNRATSRRRRSDRLATVALSKATSTAKARTSTTCPARRRTTTRASTKAKASAGSAREARRGPPVGERRAADDRGDHDEQQQDAARGASPCWRRSVSQRARSARRCRIRTASSTAGRSCPAAARSAPSATSTSTSTAGRSGPFCAATPAATSSATSASTPISTSSSKFAPDGNAVRDVRRRHRSSGRTGSRSTRKATSGSPTPRPPTARREPGGRGRGHQVVKFSPTGKVLLRLGTPGVAGQRQLALQRAERRRRRAERRHLRAPTATATPRTTAS